MNNSKYISMAFAGLVLSAACSAADRFNGFDVSNASIPVDNILSGGPPRDGIPSIDEPVFIPAGQAGFLKAADEVLAVAINGESRAYPLRILVWHEVVNDEIRGVPIAVTYCPLCGTAMVFSRKVNGRKLDFGVSGLLYQSDVLMYDRQTESLWSQLGIKAVSGRMAGTPLKWLPSEQMTWRAWKAANPQGSVLSTDTGFSRNYTGAAYASYMESPATMFPVPVHRDELSAKEWVAGLIVDGQARAYLLKELETSGGLDDIVNGEVLKLTYDAESGLVKAWNKNSGGELPVVKLYWFAWQAFYPETELWRGTP